MSDPIIGSVYDFVWRKMLETRPPSLEETQHFPGQLAMDKNDNMVVSNGAEWLVVGPWEAIKKELGGEND